MFCTQCGKQNPEAAQFCFACGNPTVHGSSRNSTSIPESERPPKTRSFRKRWLFLWAALGVIIGAGLHYLVPRIYEASTSILVVPPPAPLDALEAIVEAGFEERLRGIAARTLSRTRLEQIIQEFDLYERDRRDMVLEDVIERMKSDIAVQTERSGDEHGTVLTISFAYPDASKAMSVTEKLGELFSDDTSLERDAAAQGLLQFLVSEAEELGLRLVDSQTKLRESAAPGPQRPPSQELAIENEVLAERYRTMLRNNEAFAMAARLDGRQVRAPIGRVDTRPVVPTPISPSLLPYLLVGALGGLAFRLVLRLVTYLWRRWRARGASVPALSS